MLDEFDSEKDNMKIQAFGYNMRELLLEKGGAFKERILPWHCAVHPDNRQGEMLIPIAVWELLCIVATKKGFDPSKLAGALCVELSPDPELKAFSLDRNIKLFTKAQRFLAPADVEVVRVLTAGSSHMTAVLNLVNHSDKAKITPPDLDPDEFDISALLDEHGFLSKSRVLSCCPGMKEFCQNGIVYTCVRHQVAALCPRLVSALSLADNAGHDVFRKETWLGELLSMHAKAMAIDANCEEDWANICKAMVKGKQDPPIEVEMVAKYVEKFSGGTDAPFLHELDGYSKCLSVKRDLPGELFRDIGGSKILQEHPLLGLAIVKSSMSCTRQTVVNGKARLFSSHDIMMLEKRRDDIEAASNLQSLVRSYLLSLGVERQSYEFVLGCFDTRLAEFVNNKKVQSGRTHYESFAKICAAFISEIKLALGVIAGGAPFPFATEQQPTPAGSSSSDRVVELGTTGIVKDSSLKAKGFDLGAEVVGPEGTPHKIKSFTETHVLLANNLEAKKSRQTIQVAKNVLLTKWALYTDEPEKRLACASPAMFGADHTKEVLKLSARVALHEASLLDGTTSGLEFADPFPTVWTTRAFAKGKLVLIPYTSQVTIVGKKEEQADGPRMSLNSEYDAVLKSRSMQPNQASESFFLVPYWHVYPTPDSSQANLVIKQMSFAATFTATSGATSHSYKIPYLTNEKPISAGTQLRQYKPKAAQGLKRQRSK